MLSSVLKSETAINVSIRIIEAFVSMRKTFSQLTPIIKQIEKLEYRQISNQIKNEEKFEEIFRILDKHKEILQGVFLKGSCGMPARL